VKHVRKRITYANVMSSIAVFLVLGGATAFAALGKNTVGTRELQRNSVKRGILARNSVYPGKINLEAVKAGRIAKNAIARDRLRNGIVSTDKIQDLGVTGGKLANFAVTNPKIANDAVSQRNVGPDSIGASQIKGIVTRQAAVSTGAATVISQTVQCAAGEQAISAGAELTVPTLGWLANVTVQGNGAEAAARTLGANTLTVQVYCLQG
jgi:hypothetical protein